MRRALRSGSVLGDVLHVGADEDQTAGAALAVADRNPGTDQGLRSFEFGLLLRQFILELPLLFLVQTPDYVELFLIVRGHGYRVSWWALTAANLWSGAGNPNKERAHLLVSRFARNVRANIIWNMAIFHLTVKTGSRLGGQSAMAKSDYIEREGKYERQDDELAHRRIGEHAGVGRG